MRSLIQSHSVLTAFTIGMALAASGCGDGKKEVTLKFADCPAAVQKTIIEHAGAIQFPEVDKETKDKGRVVYEAKGKTTNGKEIEIKVAADGRLVGFKTEDEN